MNRSPGSLIMAWILAIVIHVVGGALFVFSMQWESTSHAKTFNNDCMAPIVETVAVNQADVQAEMERIKHFQAQRQENAEETLQTLRQEQTLTEELKAQQRQEYEKLQKQLKAEQAEAQQKLAEAEQARQQETQKVIELRKKMQEDAIRLKTEAEKLEVEREKERKRLAELEKEREKEKQELAKLKKQREKELAELKEIEKTKARLRKEYADIAKKQMEEEARLRQARENASRAERDAAAQQAREAAAAQQATADKLRQQREASELQRLSGQIHDKVTSKWTRPYNLPAGLTCKLHIRLTPTGDVLNVKTMISSGNQAFDASAERAAWAASPLPVTQDRDLFEREMRDIYIVFHPDT